MAPSVTEPAAAVPAVTKEVTVPVQKKKQTVKEGVTSLEALSQGMTLAGIPSFTDIEKKRHWMLEHMAGAFRVFARRGYTEGLAGHISLRYVLLSPRSICGKVDCMETIGIRGGIPRNVQDWVGDGEGDGFGEG